MKNLQLVKSEQFGTVQADIYSNNKDMFMTINQLAECLEYASKSGVENIVSRNEYLKEATFSSTHKVWVDEKQRETRIFTEDGIYEITMLSKQPKAREFRAWIRNILKALRKGEAKIIGMTDYQKMIAKTRTENTRIRKARELIKLSQKYAGKPYSQTLDSYATQALTGEHIIPLPCVEQKSYSATEIGEKLGITANRVGRIANEHSLKTEEYGRLVVDKSRHSSKEVESFRYYESIIPVLSAIIESKSDDPKNIA